MTLITLQLFIQRFNESVPVLKSSMEKSMLFLMKTYHDIKFKWSLKTR